MVLGENVSSWKNATSGVPQGSVLGPILFIIYINDLTDKIKCFNELFADDTKIGTILNDISKVEILKDDLNIIYEWTCDWLICLNEDKCKVMHFGDANPKNEYSINGKPVEKINLEKDLGVFISNDLKWSVQINSAISKANQVLGLIKRTFKFPNEDSICKLYKAFVRPHLEYGVVLWRPHWKKDIKAIESVQRRATKLIPTINRLEYTERLKKLNLTTLETRRLRGDLIQMFKIVKGFDEVNWFNNVVFKNIGSDSTAPQLRSHEFVVERQLVKNCDQRHNFFINRVSTFWNRLPRDVVNSTDINIFKNKIDKLNLESYYSEL